MPHIELHLHLEGAAPPALIRDIAARRQIDIGGIFDAEGNYYYRDFADFLRVYEAATAVLRTPEDYHELTLAVLAAQAAQGVVYTECFLSPAFCGGGDHAAWRDYLSAIQAAAETAAGWHGIEMRGVATAIRHLGAAAAERDARCAAETAGEFLCGFGIAGDETHGAFADYAGAFAVAREAGLGLTAHAGEWAGAGSVRDALDNLPLTRIGHGVRAVEDPDLVARLADEAIVLETCPGSNIALGLYPGWSDHPIAALRAAGVPVTVSTDDPPFFHTSMTNEVARLADAFGWTAAVFREITRTALAAAFCDARTRSRLSSTLEAADA